MAQGGGIGNVGGQHRSTQRNLRGGDNSMKQTMRVVAVGAAMALVVSGVAFSAPAIKVGHLADLTGPRGEVGKPYAQGVQDYKNWVNAHGGINGKQIDMAMFDYAYDKNKAVNQYKKYKEDGVVAIQGWGSGDTEALSKTTGDDKIPYISASYSAHLTDPKATPYNFFCAPDYTRGLRAGLKYLKDNWKEKRAPKVVFIYPNHPYGIAPIKGGKEYAKELGFEVLKDAKKLGLNTKFFVNIWGADETTPKLAGGAEEGALVMVGSTVYGSKAPGMKQLMEITKNQPQVTHYIRGYVSMMVLTGALKIADKKGQLNGPGVKAALEMLKNFDTGGLAVDKITFSETDHRPFTKVNITEFQKGKLVVLKTIELPRSDEWLGL